MAAKKKEKGMWSVLEPRTLKSGGWIVSLGWDKETGKNPRRKFKNKDEAEAFCLNESARRKAHGKITAGADGALVKRWMELDEKLKAARAGSLLEVGNRILSDQLAVTTNGSAKQCFDAFHARMVKLVNSGDLSGTYLADLRNRCGRFLRWFGEDNPMVEVSKERVTKFLEEITDRSGVNRRTISAWAGWAAENGWLATNPCIRVRRKGTKSKGKRKGKSKGKGKAVILSPAETTQILAAAIRSESWEVLSFLVLSLFAGIRPQEFRKRAKGFDSLDLSWEDWRGHNLAISEEMSKTGLGRLIPVQPVLQGWLKFLTGKKGKLAGHILPSGWVKLWNRWRKEHWLDAAGNPLQWHADQLRHSFGCYHLSKFRSAGDTALAMGNSAGVVLESYWKWDTSSSEAEVFWGLTPAVVSKKSGPPLKKTGSAA